MYVKKFEGDTLEETLNSIKFDLGPDAIILKTVNHKGLKSAFKKKKFEITAAISETSYIKKAKVDSVLSTDEKEKFYNSNAGHVSKMIGQFNGESKMSSSNGYGNMGLNKVVTTIKNNSSQVLTDVVSKTKNSLDEFLSSDSFSDNEPAVNQSRASRSPAVDEEHSLDELYVSSMDPIEEVDAKADYNKIIQEALLNQSSSTSPAVESSLKNQQHKIDMLEQKLFELTQSISLTKNQDDTSSVLYHLRKLLRSLSIDEKIIRTIIKKASFEFSKEDMNDEDLLFEFALREINGKIKTALPLFSSQEVGDGSVFTVLVSDVASGQTSMALRLAALCPDSLVISYCTNSQTLEKNKFTCQMLEIDVQEASSISEVLSMARKASEAKKKVFIDYKSNKSNADETKQFVDSMNRSFKNVEVLITLNAIHDEMVNRRNISKYQDFSAGVIISNVDQCLNFGALVNIHFMNLNLPFKFFGTGSVVPDDIESATSERIMSGLFQF
jgi:flagellar biosynthesis protein FlhF